MDGFRFGRQFRALRVRQARRQQDVADDAGLSRSLIAAIDRGRIEGVTVGALVQAARVLDADIEIRLWWRGGQLDRLIDEAHAAIAEVIVERLRAAGWTVEVEVSFAIWGERGSIDVLAFHAGRGALVVIEVKSAVTDSQATIHGLDRKARLAREIVAERGWDIGHVSRLLVVGATDRARRRIAGLAATFDAALPERGAAVRRWLRDPERALAAGLVFVSYDSHDSRTRSTAGRERVRRRRKARTEPKQAPMTASAALESIDASAAGDSAVSAVVADK